MVSQLIAESGTLRACRSIRREYRESLFYTGLARFFTGIGRRCRDSFIIGACCREGVLARAWGDSLTCRVLSFLLSLPGLLLHRLYLALKPRCDESVMLGLVFEAGDGAALLESWAILGLWIIPFDYWDNGYHLLGYLAVLGLLWLRMMQRGQRLRLDKVGLYLTVLAAAAVLAIPLSHYPSLSGRYLRYHIICMLCVLTTVSAPRNAGDLKRLAAAGSAVILVSAAWGVVQRLQGVEIVASYVDKTLNAGMPGRVQSYFDNPNTYAQVLVMLLPLTAALMITSKKPLGKAAALCVLLAGVLALGMTYSRASWIGLVAAAGIFLVLWKPGLIPPILILAVICIPLLPESIMNRILTIGRATSDSTVTSRFPLYQAGFELLKQSPLTGAGLGGDAVRQYILDHQIYELMVYYAHLHNVFLEVWVESGLLGFLSFLAASLWGLKGMVRGSCMGSDRTVQIFSAACCGSVAGSLLTGMVDYIWAYPRVMCIFWFVFALGLASVKLAGEEKGVRHV